MNMRIYLAWAFMMLCSGIASSMYAMQTYKSDSERDRAGLASMCQEHRSKGLHDRVSPEEEERQTKEYEQTHARSDEQKEKAAEEEDQNALYRKEDNLLLESIMGADRLPLDVIGIINTLGKKYDWVHDERANPNRYGRLEFLPDSMKLVSEHMLARLEWNKQVGCYELESIDIRSGVRRALTKASEIRSGLIPLSGNNVALAVVDGNRNDRIEIFNALTGAPVRTINLEKHNGPFLHIAERLDRKVVVADNHGLTIHDLATGASALSAHHHQYERKYTRCIELANGNLVLISSKPESKCFMLELWRGCNETLYTLTHTFVKVENRAIMQYANNNILVQHPQHCSIIDGDNNNIAHQLYATILSNKHSFKSCIPLANETVLIQAVHDATPTESVLYVWDPKHSGEAANVTRVDAFQGNSLNRLFPLADGRIIALVNDNVTSTKHFYLSNPTADVWSRQNKIELSNIGAVNQCALLADGSIAMLVFSQDSDASLRYTVRFFDDNNGQLECVQILPLPKHIPLTCTATLAVKGSTIFVNDRFERAVCSLHNPITRAHRVHSAPKRELPKPKKPWWRTKEMIGAGLAALAATSVLWRWYGKKTKSSRIG